MTSYLINLDKNADRLRLADEQLCHCGVTYERIAAVYGRALPTWQKKKLVADVRWHLLLGRKVKDGEIGCALSHNKIYKKILSSGAPCACVFEDDVVLNGDLKGQLDRIEKWIDPDRPQVVFLSYHVDDMDPPVYKGFSVRRCLREQCSEAYVITRAGAKAILELNRPIRMPADGWTRWCKMRQLELYHAYPTIAAQNHVGLLSTIYEKPNDHSKGCLYYLERVVGRTFEWLERMVYAIFRPKVSTIDFSIVER